MATSGPDRQVTAVIEGALHSLAGAGRRAASRGAGTGDPLATIRSPDRPLEAGPEVAVPVGGRSFSGLRASIADPG